MASWLSKRSASTLPEAWRVPTLERSKIGSAEPKGCSPTKKGVVYGGFFKVQIFGKIPQNNPTGHSDPIHRLWSSRKKIMNHRCYYRIYILYIYIFQFKPWVGEMLRGNSFFKSSFLWPLFFAHDNLPIRKTPRAFDMKAADSTCCLRRRSRYVGHDLQRIFGSKDGKDAKTTHQENLMGSTRTWGYFRGDKSLCFLGPAINLSGTLWSAADRIRKLILRGQCGTVRFHAVLN